MTSKKQALNHNKTASKQRSLKPTGANLNKAVHQQTYPDTAIQRIGLDPSSLTAGDVQQLQRTFGNQAMGRFMAQTTQNQPVQKQSSVPAIQAKLTIGQPNDHYEQEADRVASQVVQQINAPASAQSTNGHAVQRQEEPEEELQAKPEEELQAKPEISALQRQAEPEEELQAKSTYQREAIGGGQASAELDSAIHNARGGGQSLEPGLQQSMGQALGANFNGVRVHTDARSDQLNQSIQARAFTTGQDVFFRQGEYQPGSRDGQELIAHELTHVVQQNGGAAPQQHLDRSTRMPGNSYLARSPILEYQHSNRGNKEIIQPKSYFKTDKSKNRQGLTGTVEVDTTAVSVDLNGKMIGSEGEGVNAKGTVYMPEYKVADDRDIPPARIREQEGSGWDNYWSPSDALRVQNLSAAPRGVKLGQLLTYYHGLEARKRKKAYVIAMKVSDARGPFYAPLGFRDYNASKPWADLRQKHIDLETTLRREADKMTGEEIYEYQKKMAALKDEMEESAMIIGTEELITNAKQQFDPIWQED